MYRLGVIVTLTLKIDLFLYVYIPFVVLYQYMYLFVVQPDRLNYGTIRTCLKKGLWIAMGDYEGTTTGVKRKWLKVYVKSFEKIVYLTSSISNMKRDFY